MDNEIKNENYVAGIGDKAPEFRAMTTRGKINFPEDYKGKWVVFFSHPADFTPVCTTEFITFSKMADTFAELNTELLGLSIDSLHSHLAWADNIETIDWNGNGKVKLPFPIVVDIKMEVARKYGMIQAIANTQTVRAVYIIDPEGIIRAILFYPMTNGRSIPEIIRLLKGLQLHDETGYDTPANWEPGDDVVLGAPLTLEEASTRVENDDTLISHEWYLAVKKADSIK